MENGKQFIDFDTVEEQKTNFSPYWILGTDQYIAPEVDKFWFEI